MGYQKTENVVEILPFRHPQGMGRTGQIMLNRNEHFTYNWVKSFGDYNKDEVYAMRHLFAPGGLVLEVGANMGAHTLALAGLNKEGTVVAIEPQRIPYQILCGNVAMNSMFNVDCVRAVVAEAHGTVMMVPEVNPYQENNTGGLSMDPAAREGAATTVVAIDNIGASALDMIKADVEGMEVDVLQSGEKTIRSFRPPLYLEYQWNRNKLLHLVKSWGYRVFIHTARHYSAPCYLEEMAALVGLDETFTAPDFTNPVVKEYADIVCHMLLCWHPDRALPSPDELGENYVPTGGKNGILDELNGLNVGESVHGEYGLLERVS